MKVTAASATDIGLVRDHNEDALLLREPLFAVADGMGGHLGGEVASSAALERLAAVFDERGSDGLAEAVHEANAEVFAQSVRDAEVAGMGTTLTAAVLVGTDLLLAHVGDSRAYLLHDGELRRLTEDHTLVGEMVRKGSLSERQARSHPQRSILTRALGIEPAVEVDRLSLPIGDRDRVLLCSDGLNSMIEDSEIRRILSDEGEPRAACDRLVEAANAMGGVDNTTVVVLDFEAEESDAEPEAEGGAAAAGPDAADAADTADARTPADPAGTPPDDGEGLFRRIFKKK